MEQTCEWDNDIVSVLTSALVLTLTYYYYLYGVGMIEEALNLEEGVLEDVCVAIMSSTIILLVLCMYCIALNPLFGIPAVLATETIVR